MSHHAEKKIYIIGAGPNGFADGIRLLQQGHAVTILESNSEAGKGISYRPDCNPYAIMHSGAYNTTGSNTAQSCFETYKWFAGAPVDDPLYEIYAANSFVSGKLIIARTQAGLEILNLLQANLAASTITARLLTDKSEIADLDEPWLGEPLAALELPEVRAINIAGYLKDLRSVYEKLGGKIEFSTPVRDFIFTDRGGKKIGLVTDKKKVHYAHAVINVAGINAPALSAKAAQAAARQGIAHPETPEMEYFSYGVLKRRESSLDTQPFCQRVVYVAENSSLPSVGAHSYLGNQSKDGRHNLTLGSFYFPSDLEQIVTREIPSRVITPKIIEQTKRIFPAFDPDDYEMVPVGYIIRHQDRDFRTAVCNHGDAVLVHSYTSDSPGLTSSPVNSLNLTNWLRQQLTAARGNERL